MVLTFSPSKLELFRKFIMEEYNGYVTQQMVIDEITGVKEDSFKANFGTAIHEILEHGYQKFYDKKTDKYVVEVNNRNSEKPDVFVFDRREIEPVMHYCDSHKKAVNEVSTEMNLNVSGYSVVMRMRIDQLIGNAVTDHKTSDKEPKHDDYERSLQWKIYLMATGAKVFNYNHFQYKNPTKSRPDIEIINREWVLYPYPTMEYDVKGWCERFINFCKVQGLMEYITYKDSKGLF